MKFEVKGLVIHETPLKDNDRFLDILTEKYGRISVYGRGVRSYKSKNMASTMPMTYSDFILDRQKDNFIVLCEADKIESYGDPTIGLEVNALCMYVCDVIREFALPEQDSSGLLRLALNTLYASTHKLYEQDLIKASFELRIMSDEGFMPDLSCCGTCYCSVNDNFYLDVMNGCLICGDCLAERSEDYVERTGTSSIICPLSLNSVSAMNYIITAPLNRLFSFNLTDKQNIIELYNATQTYLINQLEKNYPTLDFFNQVRELLNKSKEKS